MLEFARKQRDCRNQLIRTSALIIAHRRRCINFAIIRSLYLRVMVRICPVVADFYHKAVIKLFAGTIAFAIKIRKACVRQNTVHISGNICFLLFVRSVFQINVHANDFIAVHRHSYCAQNIFAFGDIVSAFGRVNGITGNILFHRLFRRARNGYGIETIFRFDAVKERQRRLLTVIEIKQHVKRRFFDFYVSRRIRPKG